MDVTVALRQVRQMREAGTLRGDTSGVLRGLLGMLEHRGHLDELLGDLPNAEAVAERTEQFLLFDDPVERSDEELIELANAHLGEMIINTRESVRPVVAAALEMLSAAPINVSAAIERSSSVQLTAGMSSAVPSELAPGSLLRLDQLNAIADYDTERLNTIFRPGGSSWAEVADAFFSVSEDIGGIGPWLLAPAVSWGFDIEPFYRIWEAGASLWLAPGGIEVVRRSRDRRESSYSPGGSPVAISEDRDAAWLEANSIDGPRVLELVAVAIERGGRRVELDGVPMISLPPSFFDSTDWELIQIYRCQGFAGPDALADLVDLKRLAVERCELATTPSAWPPALEMLSLANNDLTSWPDGLASVPNLHSLRLQNNRLTEVPDSVGGLAELQQLDLSDNQLHSLPTAIGRLTKLEQLFLSGNRELATLPAEMLSLADSCEVFLTGTALPEAMQRATTIEALRAIL